MVISDYTNSNFCLSYCNFLYVIYTGMLCFGNICYMYQILTTCAAQCQANSKHQIDCELRQVVSVGTDLSGILFGANTTSSQHVRPCASCFDRLILWVSKVDNAIACNDARMSAVVPMTRGMSTDMTSYVHMGFSLAGKNNIRWLPNFFHNWKARYQQNHLILLSTC